MAEKKTVATKSTGAKASTTKTAKAEKVKAETAKTKTAKAEVKLKTKADDKVYTHEPNRISFGKIKNVLEFPYLLDIQKQSFDWLIGNDDYKKRRDEAKKAGDYKFSYKSGLEEIFDEISPIRSSDKRKDKQSKYLLSFSNPVLEAPEKTPQECRRDSDTYEASLYVMSELENTETGKKVNQPVSLGKFPMMTNNCTFIYNGVERVIISQIQRAPGVYFKKELDKKTFKWETSVKIIPARGSWIEIEVDKKEEVKVRIDRKKKQPVVAFLKALGEDFGITDQDIKDAFKDVPLLLNEIPRYEDWTAEDARRDLYSRVRPSEPASAEAGRDLLFSYYFNPDRYDLSKIGRFKINKKFYPDDEITSDILEKNSILTGHDLLNIVRYLLCLHMDEEEINADYKNPNSKQILVHADDIDHFGNRRIRQIGELVQNTIRTSFLRIQKGIQQSMITQNPDEITPMSLVNVRPLTAALREFYGQGELAQFMDQNNPLSALSHRRRLSALGKGGLSRDRAKVEVRDVHTSHYGRLCPIESPEGQNIGLIGALACYARVNGFGFIETPYLVVKKGKVTEEVVYLQADDEENFVIAQANSRVDSQGTFLDDYILARNRFGEAEDVHKDSIDLMDINPRQMISVGTSLIPFLEHDDANRALMGANMQRQAVPLLTSEAPLVGTGTELRAAKDTGDVILCNEAGTVIEVDSNRIRVKRDGSATIDDYILSKYWRTNQDTCYNQTPIVKVGDYVRKLDALADGTSIKNGELSIGKNLLVAFMNWEGYNYEDAIILNRRLVQEDTLTSIHIEEFECVARETNLGTEEITRDIPDLNAEALRNLDEGGVVRIGTHVHSGDILVGKVSPNGDSQITPEEKILAAIFSSSSKQVKDTALRMPHGEAGVVIGVNVVTKEDSDLDEKVEQVVKVYVAQKRKISPGDKLSGRHGNKGVISRVLPPEDMPFLEDGTPVDIILNPLGVPSRMNLGQVLEVHLGWIAKNGWDLSKSKAKDLVPADAVKGEPNSLVATPSFDGLETEALSAMLENTTPNADGFKLVNGNGKADLFDGRTGEKFPHPISVGYMYILKLHHLVEDKIHARSTGPYSLITAQPLGGKAQFGGQRFGEMEVWALEAYGASATLNEMMTIKSDDIYGRENVYSAITRDKPLPNPSVPESFKVLYRELQGIGLELEIENNEGEIQTLIEDTRKITAEYTEESFDMSKKPNTSIYSQKESN